MERRRFPNALPILASFAVLSAGSALAQTGADRSAEARSEPAEVPQFVRAARGGEAIVLDAHGQLLGFVHDHVVASTSGRIRFLAVSSALTTEESTESARLVPFARFGWDAEKRGFVLPMTTAELEALPYLDPERLPAIELPEHARGAVGAGDRERVAAAVRTAGVVDAVLPRGNEPLLLSRLASAPILGSYAPLATAREILIEPRRGRVAFVLARVPADAEDADPPIVPWSALTWEAGEDGGGHLRLEMDATTFETAPRLDRDARRKLGEEARRREILRFYGLDLSLPATESVDDSGRS